MSKSRKTGYGITPYGAVKKMKTGAFVEQHIDDKGRPEVELIIRGESHLLPVDMLVAKAYVPNPNNKPYLKHLDGDLQNNWCGNLEWVDAL